MSKNPEKISLAVQFETPPEKDVPLTAFLFTRSGKLLEHTAVRNGEIALKTSGADPRELRLFIAPADEKSAGQASRISDVNALKPYEAIIQRGPEGQYTILPVPAIISKWWFFCTCRVTGTVSKWFDIDNVWQDRPLCQARVHICDIDAIWYWIYKIPDQIIARIPEIILYPLPKPPIPDPGPLRVANAGPVNTLSLAEKTNLFHTTALSDAKQLTTGQLPALSDEIRQTLAAGNVAQIREVIAANFSLFHPYFCLWPIFWPYFYRCDEIAVVYTDVNGRFDTNIRYWCTGDHPDIYIWVEVMLNGVWTTVYRPPIPCHTWWNYACGTEISIHVTDPRVHWGCNEVIPGEIVWIKTVGTHTSVSHIDQQHVLQAPPGQSAKYDRIGLTDASAIYDPWFLPTSIGDYKRPFGGNLTFLLQFSSGLPSAGIYHYRWSYRKIANADLSAASDTFHALDNTVYKGYTFEYLDASNIMHFGSNSVKLGPFSVGGNDQLYIIPPTNPAMPPFSVPEDSPFWDQNTYSITFDSSALSDGLYEFKLELFNQSGALLSGIPKTTFQVPDFNTFSPSVNAPDALLSNPTTNGADAYRMLMRIDNAACSADVYTVQVNGNPSSSNCCGFVSYKPGGQEATLDLSFLAKQPNNFAVFSFSVTRGTCSDPTMSAMANANGMVIDSANGYIRNNASVYDKAFAPADLLGTCYEAGNGKGAFAEVLSVAAMATDGTYRLTANDAGKVAAFALEP